MGRNPDRESVGDPILTLELQDFAGCWRITRQIEDRRQRQVGNLRGKAVFSGQEAGLRYEETGTLVFAGQHSLEARQCYLWRPAARGIAVFFADDRPFHVFDPTADPVTASHDCPPDIYHVRYDFRSWPDWSSNWTVSGQRKDYVMTTRYTRT